MPTPDRAMPPRPLTDPRVRESIKSYQQLPGRHSRLRLPPRCGTRRSGRSTDCAGRSAGAGGGQGRGGTVAPLRGPRLGHRRPPQRRRRARDLARGPARPRTARSPAGPAHAPHHADDAGSPARPPRASTCRCFQKSVAWAQLYSDTLKCLYGTRAIDWFRVKFGESFAIELRDGRELFQLPTAQLVPSVEENWLALPGPAHQRGRGLRRGAARRADAHDHAGSADDGVGAALPDCGVLVSGGGSGATSGCCWQRPAWPPLRVAASARIDRYPQRERPAGG
jgi:hypothetical protein